MFRLPSRLIALSIGFAVVACGQSAQVAPTAPAATSAPATATVATASSPTASGPTAVSAASPTLGATVAAATSPTVGATPAAATSASSGLNYQVADGSSASYRVREQLASKSLPSDAVGTTKKVTGSLVVGSSGAIDPAKSKIVVDLTSLQSDSGRRDGFIQGGVLETKTFPTAEFTPTEIQGLPSPLPTSGTVQFKLSGNMKIHGTTKPMVWDVNAQVADKDVNGHATSSFTWTDYGLSKPTVSVVLSVEDTVKLDVTLHLTPAA